MHVVECVADSDYHSACLEFYFEAKRRTFGHRFRWKVLLQHSGQGFCIDDILFDAVVSGISGDYGHAPIADSNQPLWQELEKIIATCNKRGLAVPPESLSRRMWMAVGEQMDRKPLSVDALKPLLEDYLATGGTDHQSEAKSLLSQCSLATNTTAMAGYWKARQENELLAIISNSQRLSEARVSLEREWSTELVEMFPDPRFRSLYLDNLFIELKRIVHAIALRPKPRDDGNSLRITIGGSIAGEYSMRLAIHSPLKETAIATGRADGSWACTHTFASQADKGIFDNVFGMAGKAFIDESRECLLIVPQAESPAASLVSDVVYPYRFPMPFEVTVDLCLASSPFQFQLIVHTPRLEEGLVAFIVSANKGLNGPFRVFATTDGGNGMKELSSDGLVDDTTSLSSPWETRLLIPSHARASQVKRLVRMGVTGTSSVGVRSLSVQAVLSPTLGMSLAVREGRVIIESVASDSPAWAAGAKAGDIIETVRGQAVESVSEALDLLGDIPFEESSEVSVRRDSEVVVLSITPRIIPPGQ